jgi:hypothetical protein
VDVEGEGLLFPVFPFVEVGHEPIYNFRKKAKWFVTPVQDAGFG